MKLKKAVRELARAEFKYGLRAAISLNSDSRSPFYTDKLQRCKNARTEVERCKRQLNAVTSAMQYRGASKIAYEQPVLLATKRDELYIYIARLAWETSEIRDKMLSLCSASIKDEVEKGARSGTFFERTLGWRSDAEFYANGVLASVVEKRYSLDHQAELGVHMFAQKWEDHHFVSIVASGTIEDCIYIDEHANCDG